MSLRGRERQPAVPPRFVTTPVRVRIPATSANLGPGYDSFGLALGLYDSLVVEVTKEGVEVVVEGEGAGALPLDDSHLVVRALNATFNRLGGRPGGIRLSCVNRIPHGRGLGSSAAAIVAGVVAARALVPDGSERLDDAAALRLATELEGHPDNVAATLLGGFTIAWTDDDGARAVRLDPAPGVAAVVFVPAEAVATRTARALLPATVPHADAAANAARAALLVEALTRRPHLLAAATQDRLHQAYRAPAMPASAALVESLRRRGVAAVISGAGPTVLALVPEAEAADVLRSREALAAGMRAEVLSLEPSGAVVEPG